MSTTIELDESLAKELERRALQEGVSLAQFVDGVLRREVNGAPAIEKKPTARYVQQTYDMGEPKIPMDKIWEFLADEDVDHYLQLQKEHEKK